MLKQYFFSWNIWWVGKLLVLLHSLLRNTLSLSNIKKEFFERFYINRQVVQEAVLDYTLLYIGSMKRLGKRNEPSSNWQVRFTKLQ